MRDLLDSRFPNHPQFQLGYYYSRPPRYLGGAKDLANAPIATCLPSGLVAVLVGATSGIGETMLRVSEGKRIRAQLEQLNPEGKYHYLRYDVSLLKNVDDACRYLQGREPAINLLFLTSGTLIAGKQTYEGLNYSTALTHYSHTRFIVNLLPQLRQASSLCRVVTVGAGGKEGPIFPAGFQATNLCIWSVRGHLTSMVTLSLEAIAREAPEVFFIHDYPGFVKMGLSRELTGILPAIGKAAFAPIMALLQIPIDEAGERHAYFATSARFSRRGGDRKDADGVPLGQISSSVHSIDYEAEGTSLRVQELVKNLTKDGTAEKAWKHAEDEFVRITGSRAV
ncbi:hypothetical protein F5X99DRAFT_418830 [Biscogniauxia marginata]|nr:hypothetical protein F5X99DRAFT_418830 [Biscogniauxia marginata]